MYGTFTWTVALPAAPADKDSLADISKIRQFRSSLRPEPLASTARASSLRPPRARALAPPASKGGARVGGAGMAVRFAGLTWAGAPLCGRQPGHGARGAAPSVRVTVRRCGCVKSSRGRRRKPAGARTGAASREAKGRCKGGRAQWRSAERCAGAGSGIEGGELWFGRCDGSKERDRRLREKLRAGRTKREGVMVRLGAGVRM